MTCNNGRCGCQWIGRVENYIADHRATCPYRSVKCIYMRRVCFRDVKLHTSDCEYRLDVPSDKEFGNESTTETLAFCDNIEQHMQESGSINRYLAHLVFVGLPGSGKSTLIARLLKLAEVEEMLKACASTGVMNGVINVNVTEDILSEHPTGIANECEWQKVEHGISCLRMMGVEDDETEKNCTPEIHFEIRIQQDEDEQCQDSAGGVEADPEDNTTTQEVAAAKSGASPLPSEIPLPLMLSSESSSTAECPLPSASPSFPSEASENPSPKRKKRPVSAASRKPVSAKKVAGTRVKHQQHSSGRFNLHMIQDLLKKKGFDAVRPYLNNKSNLYLSDTGGQIEFQELLPLLVAGCAIFVFVFSLNLDISKPVRVSYRMKGTRGKVRHSNIYMSSLTIRESFLQTLASIDSMAGLFQSQTPSVAKHKPYVFVVGTHKDLVMEKHKKKAEKIIEAIDAELIALIKEHKYEDLVVFADNVSNRLLFAVDNTCENDIFSNIRARVMDLIHSSEEFHIQFPLSYLLASLDLEDSRDPFIRRKDFARNAKKYGIEKEDIDHLLHFLHSRIGQIRYFPVKEIKEIIVREPQALFNVVTYLIVQSFLLTADYAKYTEVQKGIYSFNSFTMDEFMLYSSYLKPEQVIHLLKELRIVAPFLDQKTGIEKYFIPCILNHLTECPKGLNKSIVQPLAITFDCGHCPKGMFGVLLHCIVTTKSRRLQWNLDINMIFKDQVSFKVGKYDDVITLKFCTTHLEVSCHPVKVSVRDKALSMVKICNTVRSMLSSGIEQARVSLRYSPDKTRHDFGLVCSKCGTVHKVLQEGPQHLVGMYSKKGYQDLPESGSYWFGSTPTYSFPELEEKNDIFSLKEGSSDQLNFSVFCRPPLEANERHLLSKKDSPVVENRVYIEGSSICFLSVKRSDAGRYTVTSTNSAGQGQRSFYLQVRFPPTYSLDQDCLQVTVGSSTSVNFTVTSFSPLTEAKHTLSRNNKAGVAMTKRFKVEEGRIVFQ